MISTFSDMQAALGNFINCCSTALKVQTIWLYSKNDIVADKKACLMFKEITGKHDDLIWLTLNDNRLHLCMPRSLSTRWKFFAVEFLQLSVL